MRKVFVTIGMMVFLALALFIYDLRLEAQGAGMLTITLSEAGEVIREQNHSFTEEDTLYTVLNAHYAIQCADESYAPTETCNPMDYTGLEGRILMHIGPLETDWVTTYIEISLNGDKASYGMDQLPLNDGDHIDLNAVSIDQ